MKTVDFLDAVKTRYDLPSDYALAAFMEVSKQKISSYRSGHTLGDDVAVKMAELLNLPPAYVLACVHAERASDDQIRSIWTTMASAAKRAGTKGGATVAAGILSVSISGGPDAWNPDEHGAKSPSLIERVALTLYTLKQMTAQKIGRCMRAILVEMAQLEHA